MANRIRVMIVDDSLVFREFLIRSLTRDPEIEVVGAFGDSEEAMRAVGSLRPNVITVDMEMPGARGPDFMRAVLPKNPGVKAVVISALSGQVFEAMQAGAVDFVGKPGSHPGYTNEQFVSDIKSKIKIAASATSRVESEAQQKAGTSALLRQRSYSLTGTTGKSLVAIGASTGGTEAILEVIKRFPANMPGVVIVQHMPPVFTRMYAERVDRICAMSAREAKNGDRVERGLILVAPGGEQQFRVKSDAQGYYVSLVAGPKESGHCPSVDVLFDSVATAAGANAVGVILTGMGGDGAKGLKRMRDMGAHTIGQDEASCVVYGMPKVALDIGGVAEQLPLKEIADGVMRRLSR